MNKEEIQSSLEAHEERIEEMNVDKTKVEIALQVSFNEIDKPVSIEERNVDKAKGKWPIKKDRGNFQNFGERES